VDRRTSISLSFKSTRKLNLLTTSYNRKRKKRRHKRNFISNKKYKSQPMQELLKNDKLQDAQTCNDYSFPFFSASLCSDSVISFLSERVNSSSRLSMYLHLFFLSTRSYPSIVGITELRRAYQPIERIDMCIRTIFELSGFKRTDYMDLCRKYQNVFSNNFVYYYRPFMYDLYNRMVLSVPSEVGRDVISKLPRKHQSVIRRISYSNSKLKKYKKYLVRQGILKIPDVTLFDGLFSRYRDVTWKTRTFFRTIKLLRNTTLKVIPHGFSFYQNSVTYLRIFYFFLYNYLFLRKNVKFNNVKCNNLSTLSRISLFSGYSVTFLNSISHTNTVTSTSTVFLYSFLDRIKSLYNTNTRISAPSHSKFKKRSYINVQPFFHGNSIVFIKHLSHGIKRIPFICNNTLLCATFNESYCSVLFSNIYKRRLGFKHFFTLPIRTTVTSTRLLSQSSQSSQPSHSKRL
jgi:hypothetical protein